MRYTCSIYFIFLMCLISGCGQEELKTRPSEYLSETQQNAFLTQVVLKTAKKPEGFRSPEEIKSYYTLEASTYFWHYLHERNKTYYFFISRPAPSLYGKRTGIGGYFTSEDGISFRNYREVFHTFKLKPDELEKKGGLLFEKMVRGEDLRDYQPGGKASKNQEWIEFPDAIHYFDTISQSWQSRLNP